VLFRCYLTSYRASVWTGNGIGTKYENVLDSFCHLHIICAFWVSGYVSLFMNNDPYPTNLTLIVPVHTKLREMKLYPVLVLLPSIRMKFTTNFAKICKSQSYTPHCWKLQATVKHLKHKYLKYRASPRGFEEQLINEQGMFCDHVNLENKET
jgi:hypothetical protein